MFTSKRELLSEMVESGKFCKVEFIKKDGSLGVCHGRTGVSKHTTGGKRTSDDTQYIMFWDKNKGYRNINRDTIVSVNGLKMKVKA